MLGLILSRLSQQNINWNAPSVKQLLTPLYLENTNSITPVMIIINNVVCFSVLRHNDRVEGQKYGVFGCIHARPNTHTHTHYREQQKKYLLSHIHKLECMCVNMHGGAFIAPLPVAMTHQ